MTLLNISIQLSWVKQTVQLENIIHSLLKLLESSRLLFKSSGSEEKFAEKRKILDIFQVNIKKKKIVNLLICKYKKKSGSKIFMYISEYIIMPCLKYLKRTMDMVRR